MWKDEGERVRLWRSSGSDGSDSDGFDGGTGEMRRRENFRESSLCMKYVKNVDLYKFQIKCLEYKRVST